MPDDTRDTALEHLPQQVREMAENSRRLKEEIQKRQQVPSDRPVPSTQEEERDPADTAAQTPPEPAKDPEATPAPADEWKRKHDALFGKYSSEIGQARVKIRDLEGEVERLKAAAVVDQPEAPPQPTFDAKTFSDYDAPFQDLAATVARLEEESRHKDALIEQLGGQLEQRLNQKIEPLQQSVAQREYEVFLEALRAQVPQLEALNTDPDFLAWLNTPNPYDPAGGNFRDTLQAAEARRNVGAVAKIFNDFAATSGKYQSAETPANAPATPPASRPKNVQPAATPATTPQPDKGPRRWSAGEIQQFYADLAQGKYRGREAEAQAIKRTIFEASQHGLVA